MSVTPLIVEGDIVVDSNGRPVMLEGKEKLIQDLTQIIILPMGENMFHPKYGSEVALRIGYPMTQEMTSINIKNSVTEALSYFSQIQTIQEQYQKIISSEILYEIGTKKIWFTNDRMDYETYEAIEVEIKPTTITIKCRIITLEYEEVILPFHIYLVPSTEVVSSYDIFRYTKYNIGSRYTQGYIYR